MARASEGDEVTLELDDLNGIFEFLEPLEVVEAPVEIWDIVAEHWPEMLHKRKPPRAEMH
jgi:hypothetical protein